MTFPLLPLAFLLDGPLTAPSSAFRLPLMEVLFPLAVFLFLDLDGLASSLCASSENAQPSAEPDMLAMELLPARFIDVGEVS